MSQNKSDKILTALIIVIAVAGLIYFGISAIMDDSRQSQGNPFDYELEIFKQNGRETLAYKEILTVSLDLVTPYALALDAADKLYVTGDRLVLLFDANKHLTARVPTDRPVSALAVDDNGDIYCAAGEYIEVLDSTGAKKARWQDLGVDAILTSIAVGENDVYLADAGQLVVWHFNKAGDLLGEIGKKDLADGSMRSFWSRTAMTVDGFSGCCNPSHAAVLQDGSFVTAEKGLVRVKIHNRAGEFVCLVAAPDQFDKGTVGLDLAVDSNGRIHVLDPKRKQVRIFEKMEDDSE